MQRLWLFLIPFLFLTSCFDSEQLIEPEEPISLDSLSTASLVVDTGSVARLYFSFSSPSYINQNSVNIEFFDSEQNVADEHFDVEISKFSLMSATLKDQKAYFDISPKAGLFSNSYSALITIMDGATIDSAVFVISLQGITPYEISIEALQDTILMADTMETVTTTCALKTSELISKENLSVHLYSSMGTLCDTAFVDSITFNSNEVTHSVVSLHFTPQRWCYSGLYRASVKAILGTAVDSTELNLAVTGELSPEVVTVNNVTVTSGNLLPTEAIIRNAKGFNLADLHLSITTPGDSSSLPVLYKGAITKDSIFTIGVNCKSTPAGVYTGQVQCGNSVGEFTITVQDDIDVRFMHTSPYTKTFGLGDTEMYKCSLEATGAIADTMITYTIFNDTVDVSEHFDIKTEPFASAGCQFETSITATATVPTGSYRMHIGATVGGVVSIDSAKIVVLGASITSVEDITLEQGDKGECRLKLENADKIDPYEDIVLHLLTSVVEDSQPVLRISQYYKGDAKISVDARSAAMGTYPCEVQISGEVDTFTVTVIPEVVPPIIESISSVSTKVGTTAMTKAVIQHGEGLTVSDFSVRLYNDLSGSGPLLRVSSYDATTGSLMIEVIATDAMVGSYYGRLTVKDVSKNFPITIAEAGTPIPEKSVKLYNPYAKDGYNSAFDMINGVTIAGSLAADNIHMKYAPEDSVVADLAVDNSLDIRETHIVAEVTSINGGLFAKISKAEYDKATSDVTLMALAMSKTYTDNEIIITDFDDITIDGFFVMKLANGRGYAVVQLKELNKSDSEGSIGNTGSLTMLYRHLRN